MNKRKEIPVAQNQKLSPEEFVLLAIDRLRSPPHRGIHVVYSMFNEAFRRYFKEENLDPRALTEKMASEGKIKIRPVKGGAMIYRPHDVEDAADVLMRMGLADR